MKFKEEVVARFPENRALRWKENSWSYAELNSRANRIAHFLVRQDVAGIVVACNTASAAALPQLADEVPVPVWGVIDPGVEAARRRRWRRRDHSKSDNAQGFDIKGRQGCCGREERHF